MVFLCFFSNKRRHTRLTCEWSSDVCSSDLIRRRSRAESVDPGPDRRILLVTVAESDLQAQSGWPLSDRVVGRMLEILARSRPRAIGLDIYRDVPVPPGTNQLHAVLTRERRIITVMKFGEGSSGGVRPPPVLRDTDQVAF